MPIRRCFADVTRPLARKLTSKLNIIIFLMLVSIHGQELTTMAVLDFEPYGISKIESAVLTNRMRSGLVMTGKVTVVERGMMQQILTEQDFQLVGCTSDECAVEVGRLLGVTNMVAGSIGKIGTTFAMDIRVIDIESGAIARTVTRDYQGTVDGLLKEIERLAWAIVTEEERAPTSMADIASSSEVSPPESSAPLEESDIMPSEASAVEETAVEIGVPASETRSEAAEADVTPTATSTAQPEVRPVRGDESPLFPLKNVPRGILIEPPAGYIPHDKTPEPIGGYAAILKNIEYPESARAEGIEGKVIIQAFVNQTGKVTETRILSGYPGSGLNESAVAAVLGTRFKPAESFGKSVGVWIAIPVPFILEGEPK